MAQVPKAYDPSWIHADIQVLSRGPQREELARWLGCKPTDEALQTFANKYPDKWAQGIAILMRGAGYTDKVEVTLHGLTGFAQKLEAMSDAEVIALKEKFNALPAPPDEPSEEAPA